MALNAAQLRDLMADRIGGGKLIAVSNREPYVHTWSADGEVQWVPPAGGLVTALEPVLAACGGTWVAHGAGDADRQVVDQNDRLLVPPDDGRYHLRRVWLTEQEENGYYYGFANQALWPLCHQAYRRPRFKAEHFRIYQAVNEKFATAVLEEVGDEPAWIFVQDYHFALLPKLLKERRPDLVVAHFWHIPWPHREAFQICPWADEILEGLLGNDLLGFHIQLHCNNFLETVDRTLESIADYEEFSITRRGHSTQIRAFPISVDCEALSRAAAAPRTIAMAERFASEMMLEDQIVAVGVDRLDYTKGIPERFAAVERFLEKHPEYHGRFTFLQIGPTSRIEIEEYRDLIEELTEAEQQINRRFGGDGWKPVRLLNENYPRDALIAFFRLSDLCIVSSLHDGMNLVAKEYVCARTDNDGALLLSRFTGASRELDGAIMINPYDTDAFANAIKVAIEMPIPERKRRVGRMCEALASNNIYDWAASVVTEISRLSPP